MMVIGYVFSELRLSAASGICEPIVGAEKRGEGASHCSISACLVNVVQLDKLYRHSDRFAIAVHENEANPSARPKVLHNNPNIGHVIGK